MTRNYFNYFTEIEEYFVCKRSRNLLVAPLDWCLIELWKENGIPLHVVMRGIDRSFESALKRGRSSPRTLFYCHPAVVEAFEEYQEAMLGGERGEGEEDRWEGISKDMVLDFIQGLERCLDKISPAVSERFRSRLSELRSEIRKELRLDPGQIDRELSEIGSMLVNALSKDLDRKTLKALRVEIQKELKVYKRHLSPEMFERLKQKQLEQKLRRHFQLPDFSLLSMDEAAAADLPPSKAE